MKIIRKGLLFMLMLFAFTSCTLLDILDSRNLQTVNSVSPFTSKQKRIAVINGTDYIRRKVVDQLSSRGWKVSGVITGKETFAIYFDDLDEVTTTKTTRIEYYDGYGDYKGSGPESTSITKGNYGYVSIFDLRTRKRLYVYDFNDKSEEAIVRAIMRAVGKLEENMR